MKLSTQDIDRRLESLSGWTRREETLTRRFTFPTFPDAIGFVSRLAFSAEANDHHPDLRINYTRVDVTWTTHSEKGITARDFAGAEESDRIAQAFGCG